MLGNKHGTQIRIDKLELIQPLASRCEDLENVASDASW